MHWSFYSVSLLLLSTICHAGTFTVTSGDPELICPDTPSFNVVIYSTTTFDEDTLQIVSADYDTAACGERTFTHTRTVEVVPAIFPNPPVFEERTVIETIRLLDWGRWNNSPTLEYSEPRFSGGEWKRTIRIDGRTTGATIERTLVGPLTTKTLIQKVDNSVQGATINFFLNEDGKWRTDSVLAVPRREIDRVVHLPIVVHDGVTWGFGTSPLPSPRMPVVPEPSTGFLAVLGLLFICLVRPKSSRPPTNPHFA